AAEAAQETVTEQHAEQAGAEETGEQAAEEARPIEEAAHGRRYRRTLRERAARLTRLRHAALDGPRARRCRRRRRRREGLRAAAAEAHPAPGAGIGIGHRERQHRHHGAKRKQRTNAQGKHGDLPERPFGSTQILVSHGDIVRGAAWCRRPRTHAACGPLPVVPARHDVASCIRGRRVYGLPKFTNEAQHLFSEAWPWGGSAYDPSLG